MAFTERFSEVFELLASIIPGTRIPQTLATPWCLFENYHRGVAIIQVGTMLANATVDANLREANTAAGGGAQNIAGKAIAQLTQAGGDSGSCVLIELRSEEFSRGYEYVQLVITVGANQVPLSALLMGGPAVRYKPTPTSFSAVTD